MAVRSPSDDDDPDTDDGDAVDADDTDDAPDNLPRKYDNGRRAPDDGRWRATTDDTAQSWPWPKPREHEPADPAVAVQARAAAACGYPSCANPECTWYATTAVATEERGDLDIVPHCTRCGGERVEAGDREVGLPALAATRDTEVADMPVTRSYRNGAVEYLFTREGEHTGPTTTPDAENSHWIRATNPGGDEQTVVNVYEHV